MQFEVVRLHISLEDSFSEPILSIASKGIEILERYYRALRPRYTLSLDDLQSFGGSSFAEVKFVINTLSGRGRIEIVPSGLSIQCIDMVRSEDDLKTVKDYMETCEAVFQEAVPNAEIGQRTFRVVMWIECEGGEEAARAFLNAKGNAALQLDDSDYSRYKKEFTLQGTLIDEANGTRFGLGVQPSYIGSGQLFVQSDFAYKRLDRLDPLTVQFDNSRQEFERLLRHIGLEAKVA